MAKVKVLFGQMRGKIGGTVFRHDPDGYTVASEYNGTPANPRTIAQTQQRGKMNLAGQLSKLTPYEAIAGLAASRRKARSRFVSNILNVATVTRTTGTPGSGAANVAMQSLVLSEGIAVPLGVTLSLPNESTTLTVTIAVPEGVTNVMGKKVVVYYGNNVKWLGCTVKNLTNESSTTFDFSGVVTSDEYLDVAVFVIPMIDTGAEARTAFAAMIESWTNVEATANFTRTLVQNNAFGASIYGGAVRNGE